ncbi:DUF917 domain-containing protein [Nonomuraea sp. NPDC004354]
MLEERDVAALERGCLLLGSGGGGRTATAARLLRTKLRAAPVPLLPPADLPGDSVIVPVGLAGATEMLEEKPPSGAEMAAAVAAVARWSGSKVDAIMSIESAGINGLMVFCCERPVVDADLMGRAFPRLGQSSTSRKGVQAGPYALVDASGRTTVMDRFDPEAGERLMHGALQAGGGWAAFAHRPIRVADLPEQAIVGSLSRALALGRAMLALPERAPRAPALGGHLHGAGRVVEVVRSAAGGGRVTILDDDGAVLRVEMENEYQVVFADGVPVATTPDVICLLEARTGRPLACDEIRQGPRVEVLQLPGPAFWRRPDRLPQVGPAAFGIDVPPRLLRGRRP